MNDDAAFIWCVFLCVILTSGDPDLIDAIIHWLMK